MSLTLTPMLCSRFLREHAGTTGKSVRTRCSKRAFQALLAGYRGSLRFVLRHRFATLIVTFATIGGTIFAYQVMPKGFFPTEDTGMVIGTHPGAAGHLVRRHGRAAEPRRDR